MKNDVIQWHKRQIWINFKIVSICCAVCVCVCAVKQDRVKEQKNNSDIEILAWKSITKWFKTQKPF